MKRILALFLSFVLLGGAVPAGGGARPCYFNDEERHIHACAENAGRRIALTFDDGPHPVYTDRILEVLARYHARATFFVIGENVALYPEVFGRVLSSGHAIGGHTYVHAHIGSQNEAQLRAEIEKTGETLARFGVKTRLFRPPEGVCDGKVLKLAREYGFEIILWAVDTRDWTCPPARAIEEEVLGAVSGGEIVLMHDYVAGKSCTPEALEKILAQLSADGYEFVTVNELLGI